MKISYIPANVFATPLFNLVCLSSYKKYLYQLRTAAQQFVSRSMLSIKVFDLFFLDIFEVDHSVYFYRGPADLISYIWPNNEPLLIPLWHHKDQLSISRISSYWLKYYPFLRSYYHQNLYELDTSLFHINTTKLSEPTLLLSDNNHFGHFCYDSLAISSMISSLPAFHELNDMSLFPSNIKNNIRLLFESLINIKSSHSHVLSLPLTTFTGTNSPIDKFSSINKCQDLLQFFQANTFVSHYLWTKFWMPQLVNGLYANISNDSIQKPTKVFLVRSGEFDSRVQNIGEISSYLKSLGFTFINPVEYSNVDLIKVLSKASVIVSEIGSSLINAGLFSSDATEIIALIPESLALDPTDNMIQSGLPYFLPFLHRLKFILGNTVHSTSIQSSDIAYYPISEFVKVISSLRNL